MSEPGCPPQNDHPNPMPQPEGPATAPPAELQSVNQPAPVQLVMNLTDLSNPALHQVQPYTGPAPAPEPAGIQLVNQPASGPAPAPPAELQPVNQPAPVQLVINLTDLSNPALHQVQPYTGPAPAPEPAGIQLVKQPAPGQPVINPASHHGQPYAGPAPAPPAELQPVNQPAPGQLVINLTDLSNPALHQVQPYTGPAPAPPAELQPVNQPAPVQLVINLTDLSNPALHQVQPYTGPAPAPPAELQPVNQPAPVQLVINPPGPSNPAPNQIQPYAAPAVPPLAIPFGVPPGLEYLIQIDQILIHQKVSFIEMLTGFETNNQYEIKNSIGQEIYHAKEESDCFTRNFFGSARSFQMHIKNNVGQEVIRMNRPMRCFLQEIEVQAPLGVTIGYVKQEWSWFLPKFSILGPNNEVLLEIHGPFLPIKCCGDINFEVKDMNGGKSIGRIIKQRSGFLKKCFTDATNFCIQFPLDMDVKMKTVLLGACFLIDILFFDKGGNLFLKVLKGS
ncbi:phospholipid scramblase 2-like isoform X8 [Rhinichthys klamathensis goyatoka]|uniref:phospholipid scramblase 2-like isoform X8 n=1 Tax=Rhinichthys klamathensis goyatoka TaxID=3034132 RepID=UPI0024B514A6|nr:phospholipid scramblase 2-like isoform X8 [Rhinichthys klamathensis goyatoka]